jgi:hypothetical protein
MSKPLRLILVQLSVTDTMAQLKNKLRQLAALWTNSESDGAVCDIEWPDDESDYPPECPAVVGLCKKMAALGMTAMLGPPHLDLRTKPEGSLDGFDVWAIANGLVEDGLSKEDAWARYRDRFRGELDRMFTTIMLVLAETDAECN